MATRTKKPMSTYARFVKEEYSKAYVQRLTSPQERIKAIAKRWRSCPAKKHKPGTKADVAATAKARAAKPKPKRKRTKKKKGLYPGAYVTKDGTYVMEDGTRVSLDGSITKPRGRKRAK